MSKKQQDRRPAADPLAETIDSGAVSPTKVDRLYHLGQSAQSPSADDHVSDVVLAGDEVTIAQSKDETLPNAGWPRYSQPELGEFGDYELLEKLGEGGMGVVYRARQRGADRIVALKVIHIKHVGSHNESTRAKALERFRIEAQAAARLEHENIVPVYDVGEIGEQLYFSMRLVEGPSLNEVVRSQPLEGRRAAAYLLGAARGVAEAHRLGILHRDVKPHNIMLDQRSDRPLVADFGLAKVVEADDQVTRTGEVIGTPSYMPPEQISSASAVDQRADIYALGATLYHLLIGRPPFQAANTLATMRQVLYQEPVAPRQLNAAIDRDLDTICVKCLQKEPARRYQTADELAADLQRYLEGRPIEARPIGRLERAVRWSRRNPLAAALTLLSIVLAVGVFASVIVGYRATAAALDRAELNLAVARQSIDAFYTDVSEVDLEDAPGMQPFKEQLLTRSLAYYEQLLDENQDEGLSADLAGNHFRVGAILDQLGRTAEAAEHFNDARDIQSQLLAADRDNRQLQIALSDSWNELGRLAHRRGDLVEADKSFREAEALREKLVQAEPDNIEFARKLANIRMNLGLLAVRNGDFATARALYDSAQESRQSLLESVGDQRQAQDRVEGDAGDELRAKLLEDLAKGSFNEGALAAKQTQWPEAVQHFRRSVERFANLLDQRPDSLKYRYRLATAQYMLADSLQLDGQFDESLETYGAAQANLQSLVDDNPLVDDYQEQLTTLQLGFAQLAVRLGRQHAQQAQESAQRPDGVADDLEASEQLYRQAQRTLEVARQRLEKLAERNPDVTAHRYNLAVTLQLLGDAALAFQNQTAARQYLEAALDETRTLGDESNVAALRETIAQSLAQLTTP